MPARKKATPPAPAAPAPAAETPLPEKPKPVEVRLSAARGRPMLQWVGKKPLRHVTAFPAQHVETFDPSASGQPGGQLFYGDNKEVLAHLLTAGYRGKVDLIYIDPPFDSGADYVRKVSLRGKSAVAKLDAESYSLGEQVQYTDIWANDNYLQFMFERLMLLKELLADGGCIFVHCDSSKNHLLRCILDEVFGPDAFVNEIIWSYRRWPSSGPSFQQMHDTIFFYSKEVSRQRVFIRTYEEASESYLKRFGGKTQILDTETGTRKLTTDEETKGMPQRDVWDISIIAGFKGERAGYPTQKPEELLERVIKCCSNPNALILDCFLGSGTTAAVAQKLGRRWIGCDINKGAIQTTAKRLQGIIREQLAEKQAAAGQGELLPDENAAPPPAQLSFQVHRVNDYDLAIQHNEAVALACEHIGVQRTKTDTYFDGVQGKRLVKIIPFNHPLSPADLEELKRELRSRDHEERDILIVCLGRELACQTWLEDWNRLRKKGDVPNKIEVIELRTDSKYGKFIAHQPASAKVAITRDGDKLRVEIKDFASPSIIERLASQSTSLITPQITDWRSMVDCVMIDPAWNGAKFTIALTDLPEKKTDLVTGNYEFPAPAGETTVAVKIVDMLGEEVIVTATV